MRKKFFMRNRVCLIAEVLGLKPQLLLLNAAVLLFWTTRVCWKVSKLLGSQLIAEIDL